MGDDERHSLSCHYDVIPIVTSKNNVTVIRFVEYNYRAVIIMMTTIFGLETMIIFPKIQKTFYIFYHNFFTFEYLFINFCLEKRSRCVDAENGQKLCRIPSERGDIDL